ncbi:unnamed protein product [Chilo suppressalis]|uniref:RING-type domain-containing protein n=1 Tax=Chilo suppressalis TaxID=168631 RepID=A0ABN8B878_CHISP|nr:unnamed protein product [Chilo suppressalis]
MSKNKDKKKTSPNARTPVSQFKSSKQRSKGFKNKLDNEGIAKSKQLVQKIKTNRSFTKSRIRTANDNGQRLCGNGKPMPSLADLEKMFDDSDDDAEETKVNNTNLASPETKSDTCSTPIITEAKLKSPDTIKKIADKMLDFISNLPDPVVLLNEGPPPPVIPQKKRKKSGIPYIVGNTERPRVPSKPTTNFCKGDADYGINLNDVDTDEDEHPKQRAKRTKTAKYSKSIFNAKSDEIAATLKEFDDANSHGSSDSNKTVAYEYFSPITCGRPQSFSPLPSTSKDNETIHKNDIRFNESFVNQSLSEETDDLEIINQPSETIIIDDFTELRKPSTAFTSECIMINDSAPSEIINNDNVASNLSHIDCTDDSIEIIENNPSNIDDSVIPVDDYYCSLDLSQPNNSDIIEVIDVDDVIAENKAVIEKYCKSNYKNHVTLVDTIQSNNIETPVRCVNIDDSTVEPVIEVTEQEILSPRMNESLARLITAARQNILPNCNVLSTVTVATNLNEANSDSVFRNILNSNDAASAMLQCSKQNCQSHDHQKEMCILSFFKSMNDIAKKYQNNMNNIQQVVSSPTPSQMETNTNPAPTSKGLGDCPICMESLLNVAVASTRCGHVFCMSCISAALTVSGKRCPTCRKPLRGKGFHQIFL